jgi:HlyD family secretion protein
MQADPRANVQSAKTEGCGWHTCVKSEKSYSLGIPIQIKTKERTVTSSTFGATATLLLMLQASLLDGCSREEHAALGVLAMDRVALSATANEIIIELPHVEGSFVKTGDVLVRLDDTYQKAQLDLAKAQLAEASARLEELKAGTREEEIAIAKASVAVARADLADAEATFERNSVLVDKSVVSEATLVSDQARRDAAQAHLVSALETLRELRNGARPEDLRQAEARVQAARASVRAEEKLLENLVVVASRDGRLDSLPWNLGERVNLGSPVAVMLVGDAPYARVYIPEPYRIKISVGTELEVRVDGLEDPLLGKVRWVSSEASFTPYFALNQQDRSQLMYLAEIELPVGAAELPVGVPAQAVLP